MAVSIDTTTATLFAAIIAAGASIYTSIYTSYMSRKTGKEKEKRDLLYTQLSDFYDPIYSLLSVNKRVFELVGPNSQARWDDRFPDHEIAEVWNKLVERVIVPNNMRIVDIIQTRLHLLSADDDVGPYMEFITHAYAYQIFREKPYESYMLFRFPNSFFDHVESKRGTLRKYIEEILNLK